MIKYLQLFAFALAFSGYISGCTSAKNEQQAEPLTDSLATAKKSVEATHENDPEQYSDVEGESTAWEDVRLTTMNGLAAIGATDFVWDEVTQQAFKVRGPDTIYFAKNTDLVNWTSSIELRLHSENRPLSDSIFWVNQSLYLAEEIGSNISTFGILNTMKFLLKGVRFSQENEATDVYTGRKGEQDGVEYDYYLKIYSAKKPQTITLRTTMRVVGEF